MVYSLIACFWFLLLSCDNVTDETEPETETLIEKYIYFSNEEVTTTREEGRNVSISLRFQGPKTDEDITVEYSISYPNENTAVEGEDFEFADSDKSITIRNGEAFTPVTFISEFLPNSDAIENRSLSIKLKQKTDFVIGSPTNGSGSSVLITIEPLPDPIVTDPDDFIGDKKFTFSGSEGTTFKIPYFSNAENIRDTDNDKIIRAVVVLQGANRTAGSYYDRMLVAAQMESTNLDTLLIVSPQFIKEEEIIKYKLDKQHLYWSSGWRLGFTSRDDDTNPRLERISSYTIMDSLIVKLSEYPNLKKIVFTGHSAGGQFVNRYSASSPIPDELNSKGINISFIVNNPSSYVYMDNKRKVQGTENYEVPADFTDCLKYNEYRYGLEDLPFYLREIGGADVIKNRLSQRKVIYLAGVYDNNPNANLLDVSCEAQFQGAHRFERAFNYFGHLLDFYGPSIEGSQKIILVPGVGHSSTGMFQSEIGRENTFRN